MFAANLDLLRVEQLDVELNGESMWSVDDVTSARDRARRSRSGDRLEVCTLQSSSNSGQKAGNAPSLPCCRYVNLDGWTDVAIPRSHIAGRWDDVT